MNDTSKVAEAEFGYVTADGKVYLRTSDNERVVGSWKAGAPAEGLAHYQRRYEELCTEVSLLASRAQSSAASPTQVRESALKLQKSLPTASVIGDLEALEAQLAHVLELVEKHAEKQKQQRLAQRTAAIARKKELIAEAQELAEHSTEWKKTGERLSAIVDEWKTIRGVDRKTDAGLWKEYAAARDAFGRRRGQHFANLDASRRDAAAQKEKLLAEAESLKDSTEWGPTAAKLKKLMVEWKQLTRAHRETEERLWSQFRAAQDHFFTARSKALDERDEGWRENQAKKEQLLVEAEAIDVGNVKAARAALAAVQRKWDEVGPVPRAAVAELDQRLRAVSEKLRSAKDAEWSRKRAESNPLLLSMREQVEKAQKRLERAQASGDQKQIKKAEKELSGKQKLLDAAEGAQ